MKFYPIILIGSFFLLLPTVLPAEVLPPLIAYHTADFRGDQLTIRGDWSARSARAARWTMVPSRPRCSRRRAARPRRPARASNESVGGAHADRSNGPRSSTEAAPRAMRSTERDEPEQRAGGCNGTPQQRVGAGRRRERLRAPGRHFDCAVCPGMGPSGTAGGPTGTGAASRRSTTHQTGGAASARITKEERDEKCMGLRVVLCNIYACK